MLLDADGTGAGAGRLDKSHRARAITKIPLRRNTQGRPSEVLSQPASARPIGVSMVTMVFKAPETRPRKGAGVYRITRVYSNAPATPVPVPAMNRQPRLMLKSNTSAMASTAPPAAVSDAVMTSEKDQRWDRWVVNNPAAALCKTWLD